MSTPTLPNELLLEIVRHVAVGRQRTGAQFLRLRAVCRFFDTQVSLMAVREMDHSDEPEGDRRKHDRAGCEWLLFTTAWLRGRDVKGLFAYMHDAAAYLVATNVVADLTLEEAVRAVCRTMTAVHRAGWTLNLVEQARRGSRAFVLPSNINQYVREKGGRPQSRSDRLDKLYGLLHLLTACRYSNEEALGTLKLALESTVRRQTQGSRTRARGLDRDHALFKDILHTAISLESEPAPEVLLGELHPEKTLLVSDSEGRKRDALTFAADMGRDRALRAILAAAPGLDVNARGHRGLTAMHWAARRGWTDVARLLVEREDASVDDQLSSGETPLAAAASHGHIAVVSALLTRIQPSFQPAKFNPLACAIRRGHVAMVRFLLDRFRDDIDLEQAVQRDYTPLTLAVRYGHGHVVKMLLEEHGVDPNRRLTRFLPPALNRAVARGDLEIVKQLLQHGADMTQGGGHDDLLPVELAMSAPGNVIFYHLISDTVAALGEAGCGRLWRMAPDTDYLKALVKHVAPSKEFRARHRPLLLDALWRAVFHQDAELIRKLLPYPEVQPRGSPVAVAAATDLLEAARRILVVDTHGWPKRRWVVDSPFWNLGPYATVEGLELLLQHPREGIGRRGARDCMEYLVLGEDDPRIDDEASPFTCCEAEVNMTSPPPRLIMAVQRSQYAVFLALLHDEHTDVYCTDEFGRTALWWAVHYNKETIVDDILEHTPDVARVINAPDHLGFTPLHMVANQSERDMAERLLAHPAIDPNVVAEGGWTPLHLALAMCDDALVTMLLEHPRINRGVTLDDGRTALEVHEDMGDCECPLSDLDEDAMDVDDESE